MRKYYECFKKSLTLIHFCSHNLSGTTLSKYTHTHTHTHIIFHPACIPRWQTGVHRLVDSRDPRAETSRLLYWEIDSWTITRANDVSAERVRWFRAPLWRWRKRRRAREVEKMACFHSYLTGHVPSPVLRHTELKYIMSAFFTRHFKGCSYSPHTT